MIYDTLYMRNKNFNKGSSEMRCKITVEIKESCDGVKGISDTYIVIE